MSGRGATAEAISDGSGFEPRSTLIFIGGNCLQIFRISANAGKTSAGMAIYQRSSQRSFCRS